MPAGEKQRQRVLFIDDDEKLGGLMRDYLEPYGFDLSVAPTGEAGLAAASREPFDAVLLDMMLPDIDGLEVLRRLRQESGLPVVILSAQSDETVRIVGLEMGADDYVPKTFSPRELLARLRAVIRRTQGTTGADSAEGAPEALVVRGLIIDPVSMEARLDGRPLDLTALEFRMLQCLAAHPGRVFNRESLLESVAGRDFSSFDRSIDMHISSIRRKLGDDPRCPAYIKTVRGMGYTLLKHGGGEG